MGVYPTSPHRVMVLSLVKPTYNRGAKVVEREESKSSRTLMVVARRDPPVTHPRFFFAMLTP